MTIPNHTIPHMQEDIQALDKKARTALLNNVAIPLNGHVLGTTKKKSSETTMITKMTLLWCLEKVSVLPLKTSLPKLTVKALETWEIEKNHPIHS